MSGQTLGSEPSRIAFPAHQKCQACSYTSESPGTGGFSAGDPGSPGEPDRRNTMNGIEAAAGGMISKRARLTAVPSM